MKHLFLVGGTMGVGKTATCKRLKEELAGSVFLDGDWCWDMNPFVVNDETKKMVTDNICYLLNNFIKCSEYKYIIFCWVMHEQSIIDSITARLDTEGCRVHFVSIVCSERALTKRLSADISDKKRKPDNIARSVKRLTLYNALDTVKLDNTDMSIEETAQMLARLCDE